MTLIIGCRATGPGKGQAMTKSRKKKNGLPKKTYWHLYSLQGVASDKLVRIVNKVLRREYILIK